MGSMTLKVVAIGLVALALVYGASAFKEESNQTHASPQEEPIPGQEAVSAKQFIDEANERRRVELDKKREEARLESARRKKLESNECKFWTLQNQKKPSEKTIEKVAQYCTL